MGTLKRKAPRKDGRADNDTTAAIPVQVVQAHFNSDHRPEKIDAVAEYALTGADNTGLAQSVRDDAMKVFKTIESPPGCPTDHDAWRQEVARLLGIAVYKMAARLAKEGDTMALSQLPVAMAISIEKRLLLSGAPTSYNFSVTANINHTDMLKRIQSAPDKHSGNATK